MNHHSKLRYLNLFTFNKKVNENFSITFGYQIFLKKEK